MKPNFAVHALLLIMSVISEGCAPERELSGQIFIVTNRGENIKLGLVDVHVLTNEQFKPIAQKLRQDHLAAELKRGNRLAECRQGQTALKQFHVALAALEPVGLRVEEIRQLMQESDSRCENLRVEENSDRLNPEHSDRKLTDALFDLVPEPTAQTDADGRFTLKAKPGDWLLARSQRKVGRRNESYLWVMSLKKSESMVVLSNDRLVVEPYGLRYFLKLLLESKKFSGSEEYTKGSILQDIVAISVLDDSLPVPPATADPETLGWIVAARAKAELAANTANAHAAAQAKVPQ